MFLLGFLVPSLQTHSVTLEGILMNMDWEQILTVILHNYTLSLAAINFN